MMVPLEGATSNTLFEILEEWNEQLKQVEADQIDIDLGGPQP